MESFGRLLRAARESKNIDIETAANETVISKTYLQALEQQSAMRRLGITFTDVRPGFVDTALLGGDHYPMLMDCKTTAAAIVNAILAHKHVRVIDWRWRLLTALWRRVPRWLWRRLPVHN